MNEEIDNYIQCPSDDIESFFWVFVWAILKNSTVDHPKRVQKYAEMFENGSRTVAVERYITTERSDMQNIVKVWSGVKSALSRAYIELVYAFTEISEAGLWKDEEEEARYWKAFWHGLALEGVCMSLKALLETF